MPKLTKEEQATKADKEAVWKKLSTPYTPPFELHDIGPRGGVKVGEILVWTAGPGKSMFTVHDVQDGTFTEHDIK